MLKHDRMLEQCDACGAVSKRARNTLYLQAITRHRQSQMLGSLFYRSPCFRYWPACTSFPSGRARAICCKCPDALTQMTGATPVHSGSMAAAFAHCQGRLIRVACRVEIGRSLARMGEKEQALHELEHAVTLDVEDINAHLQKVVATAPVQPGSDTASENLRLSTTVLVL